MRPSPIYSLLSRHIISYCLYKKRVVILKKSPIFTLVMSYKGLKIIKALFY